MPLWHIAGLVVVITGLGWIGCPATMRGRNLFHCSLWSSRSACRCPQRGRWEVCRSRPSRGRTISQYRAHATA